MEHLSTIGERLSWARAQLGLSLAELGHRTDLAAGYIHRLELGRQKNPTLAALGRLSAALDLPLTFLVEGPSRFGTWEIVQRFSEILHEMPEATWIELQEESIAERLSFVVKLMCAEFPASCTRLSLAFMLGVPYQDIKHLDDTSGPLSEELLQKFVALTGIPSSWFITGDVNVFKGFTGEGLLRMFRYMRPLAYALRHKISPEDIEMLTKSRVKQGQKPSV